MRTKHNISCKLMLGILAFMLIFCTPDFVQAAAVNVNTTAVVAQTAKAKKPVTKQLKAQIVSVSYNPKTMKLYYNVKFTNKSSVKITKVKIRTMSSLCEDIIKDRTVTLNLKPNQSKTVKIYISKVIDKPEKRDCSIKVLDFWAKSVSHSRGK